MKTLYQKRLFCIIAAVITILLMKTAVNDTENGTLVAGGNIQEYENEESEYERTSKRDLLAFMIAYDEYITGIEKDSNGILYVIMTSGRKIVYDDKRSKSYAEKLQNADIQDSMGMEYPLHNVEALMEGDFDPGRIRVYSLLEDVYGCSMGKVESNLTTASIGRIGALFNRNNGASRSLEKAFIRISEITDHDTSINSFLYPIGGTYNYRKIAGTNRLSPHAYGIAIDLKSAPGDYWRWSTKEQGLARLKSYPYELVQAMEDNGFIWGGKWAHFDILHFEYRPELILKARYSKAQNNGEPWYSGFPRDEQTQRLIIIIERAFE